MLNIICTIEQITPIFCVFLSIIVFSINSDCSSFSNTNVLNFVQKVIYSSYQSQQVN